MREIWREIPDYGGKYRVSNKGRVEVVDVCITSGNDNGSGYRYVTLYKNGKRKNHYIHRLVASAFCVRPAGCDYVDHIDHDRWNNRAENLEWCTQRENVNRSRALMRHPKSLAKNNKLGEKYISVKKKHGNDRFRVCIPNKTDRCFKTLDDAVSFRNEVMHGDG